MYFGDWKDKVVGMQGGASELKPKVSCKNTGGSPFNVFRDMFKFGKPETKHACHKTPRKWEVSFTSLFTLQAAKLKEYHSFI